MHREKQYIRKVTVNWKLRKNTKKEEWEQASALVLKRKAEGKPTELTIHGKIIPDKKRKKEIRRYAPKNLPGSPAFLPLETFSARTPPTANRNITYFITPWLNLQAQFTSTDGVNPISNGTIESIHRPVRFTSLSSQNHAAIVDFKRSLLRSIRDTGTPDSMLDATPPNVLMLLEEQMPFSHRHQTELQTQQTPISGPWSRLFLSLAFLSSNDHLHVDIMADFLKLAISCGFLHDLKQALSVQGPTMKLFSVALLSAALDIPGEEGFQLVSNLLQKGVNPNSAYSFQTPLQKAVRFQRTVLHEDSATVQLLLDHGAHPLASFPSLRLCSPWQMESYDNESLAKALIGMRHKIFETPNPNRYIFLPPPIFLAVEAGNNSRVRSLLQAGTDPNISNPDRMSLLHMAVERGNSAMINLLIEFGADPDLFCRTETMEAIILANPETFDLRSCDLSRAVTPLQLAAKSRKLDIVRQLLQAGANPDGTVSLYFLSDSEKGYHEYDFVSTPLQIASRLGSYEMIKMLLEAGAGVDTRQAMQPTALQYTLQNTLCFDPNRSARMSRVKLLLEWGADVNASPSQESEKSSLEAAAGTGDIDVAKLLLQKCATCDNSAPILQAAVRSGSMELVNFLLDHFSKAGLSAVDKADNWSQYLEIAAKSRNTQLVDMILSFCVDKSTYLFEKHVIDAMEVAVGHGDSRMLWFLLVLNINPNADGRACRILSKSIMNPKHDKHAECFTLLMVKFTALGLDLDKPLPGDETPLCTAIGRDNRLAAQCLISSGVDVNKPSLHFVPFYNKTDDERRNDTPEPPILQAIRGSIYCQNKNVCLVDLLIANGANYGHKTALLLALRSQKYEVAKTLLERGADPNAKDPETGMDALDSIFWQKFGWPPFSIFKSLINHGFQVKAESNTGILARVIAETCENDTTIRWDALTRVVSLLLDASARVNTIPTEKYPMTALQYAINANHKELITILSNAGADIYAHAFWKRGRTALQVACYGGNLELVQSLVAQGVDINAQPALHYGATALQFAAMQGHLKIAIFLLENGALINAPAASVEGRTALQGAAEHGRLDMIYLLLENDQDDGLEERCQEAAIFALDESRFEIAQFLREYRKV
ncbi:hypothetical protein FPSE_11812 [Fusarium pseudograminearum CS3096]|uniref:Uncharacterized protein n=1 Tax=Fusarium pseudograminearum (strain CS3096) TaxID=1028729 RepID=K3U9P4_FUSPC|nr:hypothetical protein FPSE_11812 [Fusarium pseudograminearum CS3096]EKJ68001.1 hypothetical protein FPSE_11812 [Fusarium pseudograminearum CS3096]